MDHERIGRWGCRLARLVALMLLGIFGAAAMGSGVCAAVEPCSSCGAEIAADALYCHICGTAVPEDSVFCWRCGLRLPLDARYCTLCGSRLCGVAEEVAAPPSPVLPRTIPRKPERPDLALQDPGPAGTMVPGAENDSSVAKRTTFPSRLFDSPSGTILPSRVLHLGSGWIFGFSDDEGAHHWALSFGLGGLGEALITSSRILHHTDTQSHALAGFRLQLPVGKIAGDLKESLSLALNIAATGENDFRNTGDFAASDGVILNVLSYRYRETTAGVAGTWRGERTRLHAILHVTDLRAEDVYYYADGSQERKIGPDQKEVYTSFGVGVDYSARPNALFLAEIRTAPRVSFRTAGAELRVERQMEWAAGVRFFPIPHVGLDAVVSADEEAAGLADLGIGFGLHLMIGPGL